jgi:hypothetical protein
MVEASKEVGKATGAVVIGATAVKGGITAIGFSSAGIQSIGMATIIGLSAPVAIGASVGAGVYGLGKAFKWW